MKGPLSLLIFSMILPAYAGVIIYGAYTIYLAENRGITAQLMSQGNRPSLPQTWTDDGDTSLPPEEIQVSFMLTPPVAKIGVNSGQQVKIKIMSNKPSTNKENTFYLSALDVPPNSLEQEGKDALKFTMQNRIKLPYRPAGIVPVNKATFKKLLVNHSGNGLVIRDDSANWVMVSDVETNNAKVDYETIMIAPLGSQSVNVESDNANNWHLIIIDDHGNYINDRT